MNASSQAPLASIVLPTFNRAEFLPRAIDSVLAQTFTDWELIIVDDGSTDHTPAVADSYARRLGGRLVYLRQDNAGPGPARNRGIDAARGRFVAFLDSDDELRTTRLARQIELFRRCPQLGLVYSDYAYVDLDGRYHVSVFADLTTRARTVPSQRVAPGLYKCGPAFFDELLREYFIATITGMVRREVLGSDIRFATDLSYAEEWLFFLQIARRTRVGYVNEPLCLHHWMRGSLARTSVAHNLKGLVELFSMLPQRAGPLSASQRHHVRRQRALAELQLGYESHRERQYAQAARWFGRSLRTRPSRPAATGLASSWLSGLLPAAPSDDRSPQTVSSDAANSTTPRQFDAGLVR